jgi:hypothetical protein
VGGIEDYLCAYFCIKKAIVKNELSMGDANLFLDAWTIREDVLVGGG